MSMKLYILDGVSTFMTWYYLFSLPVDPKSPNQPQKHSDLLRHNFPNYTPNCARVLHNICQFLSKWSALSKSCHEDLSEIPLSPFCGNTHEPRDRVVNYTRNPTNLKKGSSLIPTCNNHRYIWEYTNIKLATNIVKDKINDRTGRN